jgi:hypothetical protein
VPDRTTETQLTRILAVRLTKRAAIRLRLATLAARARETEQAAQQAVAAAAEIAAAGLLRIQSGRQDLLSGNFQVNAVQDLRQTVATVNDQCAAAQQVVREAVELAAAIDQDRQVMAHNLLSADQRCERLQDKLKDLKRQLVTTRDERDIEDFASTQVSLAMVTPAAVGLRQGPPQGSIETEVSESRLWRNHPRSPIPPAKPG